MLLCVNAKYQSVLCWKRLGVWKQLNRTYNFSKQPRLYSYANDQATKNTRQLEGPALYRQKYIQISIPWGSPAGTRSFMGVLNICSHPLSLTICLSTCTRCFQGCGAARESAQEIQKGKVNYHQWRGTQRGWGVPSHETGGVPPAGHKKFGQ